MLVHGNSNIDYIFIKMVNSPAINILTQFDAFDENVVVSVMLQWP